MPCYLEQQVTVSLPHTDHEILQQALTQLGWSFEGDQDRLVIRTSGREVMTIANHEAMIRSGQEHLIETLSMTCAQTILRTAAQEFGWTFEVVNEQEHEFVMEHY
jgi:hypothetical protein